MQIVYDYRVRVELYDLTPEAREDLDAEFTHVNPDYGRMKGLGLKVRTPKYLRSWAVAGSFWTAPRGGLERVLVVLRRHEVGVVKVLDHRSSGSRVLPPGTIPRLKVELWSFQRELEDRAVEAETCIVRAPQGSGKTTAGLAILSRLGLPSLVTVPASDLLGEWRRRCVEELGMREEDVGVLGGGQRRIKAVTIAMQQTLAKLADGLRGEFGVLICDEVQRLAAPTFRAGVDPIAARYRIGLSADERRKDGKEFLIYDTFGPVAFEVGEHEVLSTGKVLEVEIRVVETEFDAPWWRGMDPKKRIRYGADQRLADELVSDERRNRLVDELVGDCVEEGEQVLVLSRRREHCHRLEASAVGRGVRTGLLIGGPDYAEQFDVTRRLFLSGEVRAAFGTFEAVGTGSNLPEVARGVFAWPVANDPKNRMNVKQYTGRFARAGRGGKSAPAVYVLWDRRLHGARPLANLCRWYRRVRVLTPHGVWVDGKQRLKEVNREDQEQRERDDSIGGLFEG